MKKRFFSVFLTRVMCVAMSIPSIAFAAEEPVNEAVELMPLEESDLSREEALEILGMTETEADGQEIFVATCDSQDTISPRTVTYPTGLNNYTFGGYTFTYKGTGATWKIANDVGRMKWGAQLDSASDPGLGAEVTLHGVHGALQSCHITGSNPTWNSDQFYVLEGLMGREFHWEYYAYSGNNTAKVTMVLSTWGYN